MGHLTCGVFERHARAKVHVGCYPYGSDDGSDQRVRIIAACDSFQNTTSLSDFHIAEAMTSAGVHISVDLMAHTTGTRLGVGANHPGTILVNYLGYPGTVGGSWTDYLIGDRVCVAPETAADEISEKLVVLPHHYQANDFLFA